MNEHLASNNVVIRAAIDEDLTAVREIGRSSLDLDTEDAPEVPGYIWRQEEGTERVRLVALVNDVVKGVVIGSLQGSEAFLDLIAVMPSARGNGIAGCLLTAWEAEATQGGVTLLKVGENVRAYAWPGVDIRYTAALCLLEKSGYGRTKIVYNMDLPLHEGLAPSKRQLERIAKAGVTVRRANRSDRESLAEYAGRQWNETWAHEVLLGIEKDPPATFLAFREDRIIGFAAHGIYRPCLYGPIATDPAEHGAGIGDVLSRMCLADMADAGMMTAQIGWVAEDAIPFYSHTVGARLGRCFWMLEKAKPVRQ